ncbi:MAG: hypothetical protein RBS39_08950 [Phycisphaerales bacterium]|nr:hypothetical protein [Phycisphaerales bacterium]
MTNARHLLAFAGLLVLAAPALAQNALGDGRALDANLSTRGRTNSAGTSLAEELRFRNAIVTGNAPNGLSFRGDVGYTDPFAFRGEVGSDDLFQFRRDSLLSGLGGQGIRATDALQYQFSLTTGSVAPSNLTGSYFVGRAGSYPSTNRVQDLEQHRYDPVYRLDPTDPNADRRGTGLWTLRSTAAYGTERSGQATLLRVDQGNAAAGQLPRVLTASPLGGLSWSTFADPSLAQAEAGIPIPGPIPGQGPGANAQNSAETPANPLVARPTSTASGQSPAGVGPGTGTALTPATPGTLRAEADPLASIRARAPEGVAEARAGATDAPRPGATTSSNDDWWQSQMDEIRATLAGQSEAQSPNQPPTQPGAQPTTPNANDPSLDPDHDPESLEARIDAVVQQGVAALLRESGGMVNSLTARDGDVRNLYDEHMTRGQRALSEFRFFDAEQRFVAALGLRPDEPGPAIGRVHAQLGGGLYLSAALNMRKFFIKFPELVGVRYGPALLPTPERRKEIEADLRAAIERGGVASRESGLLLAYLGYQTQDRMMVLTGLTSFAPRGLEIPDAERAMGQLLRGVWLDGASGEQSRE